ARRLLTNSPPSAARAVAVAAASREDLGTGCPGYPAPSLCSFRKDAPAALAAPGSGSPVDKAGLAPRPHPQGHPQAQSSP
ncbi:hypothetical protein P7K49_029367, partial [Saguinus oedipus]